MDPADSGSERVVKLNRLRDVLHREAKAILNHMRRHLFIAILGVASARIIALGLVVLVAGCERHDETGKPLGNEENKKSPGKIDHSPRPPSVPTQSGNTGETATQSVTGNDSADFVALQAKFRELAKKDPSEAMRQAIQLPAGKMRAGILALIVGSCSASNVGDVIRILAADPYPEDLAAIKNANWLGKYSAEFAKELASVASATGDPSLRNALLQRAAEMAYAMNAAQPQTSFKEVMGNYTANMDAEARSYFANEYLKAMSVRNATGAADLLLKGVPDVSQSQMSDLLRFSAKMLSSENNAFGNEWVSKVSQTYPQYANDVYFDYTTGWLDMNAVAASTWVRNLSAGDNKDYATLALIQYLKKSGNPGEAKNWVAGISNESVKKIASQGL